MLLLPFEDITYKTSLPEAEVLERLHGLVETGKNIDYRWTFRIPEKSFQGKIDGSQFDFRRIIFYRNSFLPQIIGHVASHPVHGTLVYIQMRLNLFVMAFVLGIGLFLSYFIPAARDIFSGKANNQALYMLAGVYVMTVLAFKFESRKAKKILSELFEAE